MRGWIKFRALLATARIANVPSVVSNVFTGAVLAFFLRLGPVFWACFTGVCLYLAGNFLNDWCDREWDRKHRPERALPRSLFCPSTYLAIAVGLFAMAAISAWGLGDDALVVCIVIALCVIAYTWLHKRTGWGVVWVAVCRSLLLILGMVWIGDGLSGRVLFPMGRATALLSGLPLFFYIVGLSVSARFEAKREIPAWASLLSSGLLLLPVLLVGILWYSTFGLQWVLLGAMPYLAWMLVCYRRRKNIARYVSGLLAGIPLVDGMVLLPFVLSAMSRGFEWEPVAVVVFPCAFVLGLLLQKVAPAS